jgi:hypothetical protein
VPFDLPAGVLRGGSPAVPGVRDEATAGTLREQLASIMAQLGEVA